MYKKIKYVYEIEFKKKMINFSDNGCDVPTTIAALNTCFTFKCHSHFIYSLLPTTFFFYEDQ